MVKGDTVIKQIPLDQVDQDFKNIRAGYDPGQIIELAQSIKRIGLLQPIIVRRENGNYQIICGHRRFLAVKSLSWTNVPAIVMSMDDQEVDLAKIHENIYREDVNKIEEAKYYMFLMQKYGYTEKQVAEKINKTPGYVCQHVEIINYCPELKKALEEKEVSFSVARELNKINGIMRRRTLIRQAIENGITARTAAIWRKEENMVIDKENKTGKELDDEQQQAVPAKLPSVTCQMCDGKLPVDQVRSMILCPLCKARMLQIKTELIRAEKEEEAAKAEKPPQEPAGGQQKE